MCVTSHVCSALSSFIILKKEKMLEVIERITMVNNNCNSIVAKYVPD